MIRNILSCIGAASLCLAPTEAAVRVFMAPPGQESSVASTGNTQINLPPGGSTTVNVWIEDTEQAQPLISYQVIVDWDGTAQGPATGTVGYVDNADYVCVWTGGDLFTPCSPGDPMACGGTPGNCVEWGGDSTTIDTTRGDWVFAGVSDATAPHETDGAGFGFGATFQDLATGLEIDGLFYLGQFDISASADADGSFELQFRPAGSAPAGGTELNTVGSGEYIVDIYQPLTVVVGSGSCNVTDDCVDPSGDTVTDDACVWGSCVDGSCSLVNKSHQADLGGPFGACPPDGFCNVQDRNLALLCFSGQTACAAINIDAGGSFGACEPDGVCNIFDANAALTCFQGTNSCGCGPQPETPSTDRVAGITGLQLRTSAKRVRPGQRVAVDVVLTKGLDALQAYQLHLQATGGLRGQLVLEDIVVDSRRNAAFSGSDLFDAVNTQTSQMLRGRMDGDTPVASNAYLATFIYRATRDASGPFVVDVRSDDTAGDQTFLISNFAERVVIAETLPTTIDVVAVRSPRSGR